MKKVTFRILAIAAAAILAGCTTTPDATSTYFSSTTYSYSEDAGEGYVMLRTVNTPYQFPIKVDIDVTMTAGKDNTGNALSLADVITFIETDQPYTVVSQGARQATITGAEVTYANNNKITFEIKDNDFLQKEAVKISFTITSVTGSKIGTYSSTTLSIIDDEFAPRLQAGYYKTAYTSSADAADRSFYLTLYKTGKYEYVAADWFGLPRPRLVGVFNPLTRTLTFDGTDYDHLSLDNPVNAFYNDTLMYNNREMTEVLKFYGSGANGKGAIVLTTDDIAESTTGYLVNTSSACGFAIYNYSATAGIGVKTGIYDSFTSAAFTYSKTNYAPQNKAAAFVPFTTMTLKEIK